MLILSTTRFDYAFVLTPISCVFDIDEYITAGLTHQKQKRAPPGAQLKAGTHKC